MRLSVITTLALTAGVLAVPCAVKVRRDSPVTDAIASVVDTLQTTVANYTSDVENLVSGVKNSVSASLSIVANVNADFAAIQSAINTAAAAINTATAGAAGGLAGAATGLTDVEIAKLTQTLKTVEDIVAGISITAGATVTNLAPAAQALLGSEVGNLSTLVALFVNPLLKFGTAVRNAQATVTITAMGLTNAINGLNFIVANLASQ